MGSYELLVKTEFAAAHHVRLPDGERESPHDHNWRVDVFLAGDQLNDAGMLVDFTVVQSKLRQITNGLKGRLLNELPGFAAVEPTTEWVAKYMYDQLEQERFPGARVTKVRVWETPDCAAAYVPG